MDMTYPNCRMTAICDNEIVKGKCKYCGAGIIFDTRKKDNVVSLRDYTPADKIKHITFSRMEIEQTYECTTCDPLQVVNGVCIHTKPKEDHE